MLHHDTRHEVHNVLLLQRLQAQIFFQVYFFLMYVHALAETFQNNPVLCKSHNTQNCILHIWVI